MGWDCHEQGVDPYRNPPARELRASAASPRRTRDGLGGRTRPFYEYVDCIMNVSVWPRATHGSRLV